MVPLAVCNHLQKLGWDPTKSGFRKGKQAIAIGRFGITLWHTDDRGRQLLGTLSVGMFESITPNEKGTPLPFFGMGQS